MATAPTQGSRPTARTIKRRSTSLAEERRKAWMVKLKFLKKFGQQLITQQNADGSSLFSGGFCSSAKTYAEMHRSVWARLSADEKNEFDDFRQAEAFRTFINNTKYLFSPSNKLRRDNLMKKRWLYDELLNLGFTFLPSSYLIEEEEEGQANRMGSKDKE
jgi:hypothetical protein